jgi:hypothetical protein
MDIYLNVAEWGPGLYGAEAAARYYFHKSAAPVYKTKWNGAGTTDDNERVRAEEFEPQSAGSTKLFRASGVRLLAS